MELKVIISYFIILISILTIFNRGFNACIDEDARAFYKPFKLCVYTIFSIVTVLALLSIVNPLLMKISQGIALLLFTIAGMMNISSLYISE